MPWLLVVLAVAALLPAHARASSPRAADMTAFDYLSTLPEASTYLHLMARAGLTPLLQRNTTLFTFLVPTNASFAVSQTPNDTVALNQLLRFHILEGDISTELGKLAPATPGWLLFTSLMTEPGLGGARQRMRLAYSVLASTLFLNDQVALPTGSKHTASGLVVLLPELLNPPQNTAQLLETTPQAFHWLWTLAHSFDPLFFTGRSWRHSTTHTLFAPHNIAFDALPPALVRYLLLPAAASDLDAVIKYHIFGEVLYSHQFPMEYDLTHVGGLRLGMSNGDPLIVSARNGTGLGAARIAEDPGMAKSTEPTHEDYDSSHRASSHVGEKTSPSGGTLWRRWGGGGGGEESTLPLPVWGPESRLLRVGDSGTVMKADIPTANGVVHIVNTVLLPPSFRFTLHKALMGLNATLFVAAMQAVDAFGRSALGGPKDPHTLFVPTNAAMREYLRHHGQADDSSDDSSDGSDARVEKFDGLERVVLSHVATGWWIVLEQDALIDLVQPHYALRVQADGTRLSLAQHGQGGIDRDGPSARIVSSCECWNGVIYVVDSVFVVTTGGSHTAVVWGSIGGALGGVLLLAAVVAVVAVVVLRTRRRKSQ